MAPEAIMNLEFSPRSDVWSFGITAIEIFSRKEPYGDQDPMQVALVICKGEMKPTLPANFPADLIDIFMKCFEMKPENRPNTADLIAAIQKEIEKVPVQTSPYSSLTLVQQAISNEVKRRSQYEPVTFGILSQMQSQIKTQDQNKSQSQEEPKQQEEVKNQNKEENKTEDQGQTQNQE